VTVESETLTGVGSPSGTTMGGGWWLDRCGPQARRRAFSAGGGLYCHAFPDRCGCGNWAESTQHATPCTSGHWTHPTLFAYHC